MSRELTAKERNTAFQHWCSLIARESRDLAALERMSARALQDRDVRADALLQNMIRAELERQRASVQREVQRDQQSRTPATRPPEYYSSASRRDDVNRLQDTSLASTASDAGVHL